MIPGLIRALCWAHFRRDFINVGKSLTALEPWANEWVSLIGYIYQLNDKRLAAINDPVALVNAQDNLESALEEMVKKIDAGLKDHNLYHEQRKVLNSAKKNWSALTVFVDNPLVPMDNNAGERALRPAALGRKNYYGTHSVWSGEFAAVSMSLLQTAAKNGLNPQAYLLYLFDTIAKSGGLPPQPDILLPWNIPKEDIERHSLRMGGSRS